MSDAAVRTFERRWRESGDPEDGASFLRACVRAGRLARERVELAAWCGHAAARAASEPVAAGPADARAFFEGLVEFGHVPVVRAIAAVARAALAAAGPAGGLEDPAQVALDAVEAWTERQEPEALRAVDAARWRLFDGVAHVPEARIVPVLVVNFAAICCHAGDAPARWSRLGLALDRLQLFDDAALAARAERSARAVLVCHALAPVV